ncbi:hypothetical protein BDA96_03G125700 [Sorghum bicolor]|uniref:Uncharacterized protein n=1 Tax=Sorghum bicolor TaxID=4558 RepID=A0A921UPM5_SORBI|nr:hypothetical protein BDA96_03G125700 [Sorghum bicolor]
MGSDDSALAARAPTVAILDCHGAARPDPTARRRLGSSQSCLLPPVGVRSTKPYLHLPRRHRRWLGCIWRLDLDVDSTNIYVLAK